MLLTIISIPGYAADTGSCGDDLTWNVNDEGTLTISGDGEFFEYAKVTDVPWNEYRDSVR